MPRTDIGHNNKPQPLSPFLRVSLSITDHKLRHSFFFPLNLFSLHAKNTTCQMSHHHLNYFKLIVKIQKNLTLKIFKGMKRYLKSLQTVSDKTIRQ